MGTRGPVPKRSDEGHRTTRARKRGVSKVAAPVGGGEFEVPEPDEEWHRIAKDLWAAALVSPQRKYYTATDWMVLYSLCDDLSYYKSMGKRSGQMLASLNSMMTSLLLTEGDRRRVQIELEVRTEEELESAGVASMRAWAEARASG